MVGEMSTHYEYRKQYNRNGPWTFDMALLRQHFSHPRNKKYIQSPGLGLCPTATLKHFTLS